MGGRGLSWDDCLPVVESETRRYRTMGRQIGLDPDDLRQEGAIAAMRCLKKWRPEGGGRTAYVRRAVRNHYEDMRRKALREMRMPRDAHGRPQPSWILSYEALVEDNHPTGGAECDYGKYEARMVLRILEKRLPAGDWELLVQSLVVGAQLARSDEEQSRLRDVCARAQRIINQVLEVEEVKLMPAPVPKPEELPECHARGEQPQGYDVEDGVCWNCRDKFTCLPDALDRHLIEGALGDDKEVEGVLSGSMSFRMAIERMRSRLAIMQRGGTVPAHLRIDAPVTGVTKTVERPKARSPKPAVRSRSVTPLPSPTPAPKPEKPGAKAKPKPEPTTAKKSARAKRRAKSRKLVDKEGRPCLKNGRPLPPVRANTPEQMEAAIKRIKIHQPFPLEVGMQLVRKTKEGDHVIVKLRPRGFELDGVLYSSLSTAVMYRLRKMQSGNAYFDLEKHQCTEIWSEDGTVLAGHSTQ